MAAEHDGHPPADPLMAAILGEPLPPGSAEAADVAVLREQLGIVGRVLSEPPPPPRPAVRVPAAAAARPGTRHRRRLVLGALAVACAGAFLSGMAWLVTQSGGGASQDTGASSAQADSGGKEAAAPFGSPGYLACARLVAEGTVTGAQGPRITVRVTRQYTPGEELPEVTFLTTDGADGTGGTGGEDGTDAPRVGDRVLFGLPAHSVHPDALFTGEAEIAPERARITAALPEARTLTCE